MGELKDGGILGFLVVAGAYLGLVLNIAILAAMLVSIYYEWLSSTDTIFEVYKIAKDNAQVGLPFISIMLNLCTSDPQISNINLAKNLQKTIIC